MRRFEGKMIVTNGAGVKMWSDEEMAEQPELGPDEADWSRQPTCGIRSQKRRDH